MAYCAPEPVTSGTWNLLMLWIKEEKHKQGYGSALVAHVEKSLVDRGGRLLIVETSGLPEFESARIFYNKVGFTQEAKIKDFFTAGEDKLIYTKPIN
ncbi:MAG: GNAT family N-acetyltransferase [Chloroflexaceae bacterium]|nr:GNAT family N-acetyltransferase [Chloroflexaceae bacterium]